MVGSSIGAIGSLATHCRPRWSQVPSVGPVRDCSIARPLRCVPGLLFVASHHQPARDRLEETPLLANQTPSFQGGLLLVRSALHPDRSPARPPTHSPGWPRYREPVSRTPCRFRFCKCLEARSAFDPPAASHPIPSVKGSTGACRASWPRQCKSKWDHHRGWVSFASWLPVSWLLPLPSLLCDPYSCGGVHPGR